MEDMWVSTDNLKEQKCEAGVKKALDVFDQLFKWLARGKDSITKEDVTYGISRIMVRDVDIQEVHNVFDKYADQSTKKLNKDNFILAAANGELDKTFGDKKVTETFIS